MSSTVLAPACATADQVGAPEMHRWCHGTYAMTIPASGPVPVARQRCDCVCHTSPTAGTGAGRTPDG